MRSASPTGALATICLLLSLAGAAAGELPTDAERLRRLPLHRWSRRQYAETVSTTRLPREAAAQGRPACVPLPVDLGRARATQFVHPKPDFGRADLLVVDLLFPADFPAAVELYVFVKDWDSQWLHIQRRLPHAGGQRRRVVLPLSGAAATRAWRPRDHHRPWHQLTRARVTEFGLKFAAAKGQPSTWQGTVRLAEVALFKHNSAAAAAPVRRLRLSSKRPRVGEMLELSFETGLPLDDPFDREDVSLTAAIAQPDGRTTAVQGFYYEGFLADVRERRTRLVPQGFPQFRFRFTPTVAGDHSMYVEGTIHGHRVELAEIVFTARAAPQWKGFVRRSRRDDRLLAWDNGDEFWGQGLNVRSPYDHRYRRVFPATGWRRGDIGIYRELFARYAQAGINVVEVWMCSWWLALEWIPDAPGNHGVGHMNQWRAWKLDRLLAWAEEYDIYLILVLNNHGKFSTWCDKEWHRNPFNKRHDGYLDSPNEYFTDARAHADFKALADYLLARWGYSPHILAWKLFTEIDLTGAQKHWYRQPAVRQWHTQMAAYLKQHDVNKHLVTTHWSGNYSKAAGSMALARLDGLDLLTLDAYYGGDEGTAKLHNLLRGTQSFQQRVQKPCMITEYGGTPWADSLPHLRQQLHVAQWAGFFDLFPVAPLLWWFPLVEERELYNEYTALAAFTAGERRAGMRRTSRSLQDPLALRQLQRPGTVLMWVFDKDYFFHNNRLHARPRVHKNVAVTLAALAPGKHRVEFWHCRTGEVIHTQELDVTAGQAVRLHLPPFDRDLAVKIKATHKEQTTP